MQGRVGLHGFPHVPHPLRVLRQEGARSRHVEDHKAIELSLVIFPFGMGTIMFYVKGDLTQF
jgi:hypothetical protein